MESDKIMKQAVAETPEATSSAVATEEPTAIEQLNVDEEEALAPGRQARTYASLASLFVRDARICTTTGPVR